VDLRTESQEQFVEQVLHTLSVASVLSGRRLALPFVPCDSAWLKHTPPPPEHASSSSSVPAFGTCRTGLCDDWRVYRYGTFPEQGTTRASFPPTKRAVESETCFGRPSTPPL